MVDRLTLIFVVDMPRSESWFFKWCKQVSQGVSVGFLMVGWIALLECIDFSSINQCIVNKIDQ